jgi:hypothetical protein
MAYLSRLGLGLRERAAGHRFILGSYVLGFLRVRVRLKKVGGKPLRLRQALYGWKSIASIRNQLSGPGVSCRHQKSIAQVRNQLPISQINC